MKDSDFQSLLQGIREAGSYLRENTKVSGPTARETQLLDAAQRDYEANSAVGSSWPEVEVEPKGSGLNSSNL